MSNHDESEWEPTPGLPAQLPDDERIVWQGQPNWLRMARQAFHINKVAVYFCALVLIDLFSVYKDGISLQAIMSGPALTLILSIAALAILSGLAWLTSTVTIYTLTNKRILIRFGIAIQITLDIPLNQVLSANMIKKSNGFGDIALTLTKRKRTSYFVLWPHVRPWQFTQPQPMLRAIPNVESVAMHLRDVAVNELDLADTQAIERPTLPEEASSATSQHELLSTS